MRFESILALSALAVTVHAAFPDLVTGPGKLAASDWSKRAALPSSDLYTGDLTQPIVSNHPHADKCMGTQSLPNDNEANLKDERFPRFCRFYKRDRCCTHSHDEYLNNKAEEKIWPGPCKDDIMRG